MVHAIAAAANLLSPCCHHYLKNHHHDSWWCCPLCCCRIVKPWFIFWPSKGKIALLSFMVPSLKERGTSSREHLRKIPPYPGQCPEVKPKHLHSFLAQIAWPPGECFSSYKILCSSYFFWESTLLWIFTKYFLCLRHSTKCKNMCYLTNLYNNSVRQLQWLFLIYILGH